MSIDTDIDDTDLDEKVEQSLDILGRIETEFDAPVFTCSFGKDSNAVLDLADRAGLDLGGQRRPRSWTMTTTSRRRGRSRRNSKPNTTSP